MTNYVIPAPQIPSIPVSGGGAFPVRRVYCIGRNYAAHAVEMGHDPDREPPFFFQKNPNNLDATGEFPYPRASIDVHHEVELLIALKSGGTNIPLADAPEPCLGLCRLPRHDPARPAGRGEEAGSPVGDRQGVRALGPGRTAASGVARWVIPTMGGSS